MKSLLPIAAATVAVLSLVGMTPSVQAQNPAGANAQKHGIAVVDIGYIFNNHKRHQAAKESMKAEITSTEAELKADGEKIRQMEEQRNTYNAGAPEYKQLDEELARKIADFKLKTDRLRKTFMERESKVYYQTYLEITDAVKYYAERHDIGVVVRFNGEQVDPNRREDVYGAIQRTVVFQNQIDITPDVLALLNRDAQATPQIGRPQAGPGTSIPR